MNKELKYAQNRLTESMIRKFWRAMTMSFPAMCVNDGISIEYHDEFQQRHVDQLVDKLTRCKAMNVACPIFQYEYDPPNSTPHHVSAITLTHFPSHSVLSFFDPKGTGSLRPREEELLTKILAKSISGRINKPVYTKIYNGDNLQKNDYIGLCQLYSLFYLYEYVTEVTKLKQKPLITLSDPNLMVEYIREKRNGFTDRTIYSFWNGFFQHLHKK